MAQIFWEQIRNALPAIGEYLTGSLTVSGSLGVTGSIFYNGQLLEDFVDARALSATTDFNQITNKPADLFSGSFVAGPNITINQIGQRIEISGSAATSYSSLTDIPVGIVSSSNQVNFLDLNSIPSGLVSSSNQITLTTSSILDFNEGVISTSGQAYIDSAIQGNLLSFTRLNGGSDAVDLGDVVPSTPTGSLVYSGSYNEDSGLFTLYRNDGNIDVDLSSLGGGGGGGGGSVSAGSGIDVDYNVGSNTYTVSAEVSTIFGTEIKGEYIAIATGSNYFINAVLKSGLFRQTGSYWSTTNDLQITGSLSVDVTGSGEEFVLSKDGEEKFKLNQDGVILFVSQSSTPSPIAGGMYYDQTDAFYLGFQN